MSAKPPYRVPPLTEINAVEPNGFRAVSTFAGCGGSSLGYRMAGYRMIWASEFIPAAGDTYEANKRDWTVLDRRDIRQVKTSEIAAATGLMPGQLDVFDGSPPCASFSMAGKRAKLWGEVKSYSDTTQRVDDLFGEYLRLVRGLRPKVAVAENVPGLTVGVARGFYNEVMAGFEDAGYVAEAAILEAEWLGVPQARHRLFFVAVRKDLADHGLKPVFPEPFSHYYSIRDACPWIGGTGEKPPVEPETDIAKYAIGAEWEKMGVAGSRALSGTKIEGEAKFFSLVRPNPEEPCPTVTATASQTGAASVVHPTEKRKFSVAELKRLCSFPDDFVLTGGYAQQVERLGRAVMPPVTAALGRVIAEKILVPWRDR